MFAQDLDTSGIIHDSYKEVVLGRRTCRFLDPTFKVSREEIGQIIAEAMVCTPNAVDSCPYKFLVFDTDEAKKKIDDIMWPVDKDRVPPSSFTIIPLADRKWIEDYDKVIEANRVGCPSYYEGLTPEFLEVVNFWYASISAGDGRALDISVTFQAGLVTQSLMLAARAHGLDSGFMDAWNPSELASVFGIDLERYIPQGVIAFGKSVGPTHNNYRPDVADAAVFF